MSLQDWLQKRKMSDQAFGEIVGLSQGYINRVRRGIVNPSITTAIAIRNATNYEVTVDDLLPRRSLSKV